MTFIELKKKLYDEQDQLKTVVLSELLEQSEVQRARLAERHAAEKQALDDFLDTVKQNVEKRLSEALASERAEIGEFEFALTGRRDPEEAASAPQPENTPSQEPPAPAAVPDLAQSENDENSASQSDPAPEPLAQEDEKEPEQAESADHDSLTPAEKDAVAVTVDLISQGKCLGVDEAKLVEAVIKRGDYVLKSDDATKIVKSPDPVQTETDGESSAEDDFTAR